MLPQPVQDVPSRPRGESTTVMKALVQPHGTCATRRRRAMGAGDPLRALASLIATALHDKLAHGDTDRLLRKLVGGRNANPQRGPTIAKLIDQYLKHADTYYRHPDGTLTGETTGIEKALAVLRQMYGRTPAAEFRPLKLKAVQQKMVEKGWCRKTVNNQIGRVTVSG
jgi:hypothetical protein